MNWITSIISFPFYVVSGTLVVQSFVRIFNLNICRGERWNHSDVRYIYFQPFEQTLDPCIFSISGHRYKWQNKYLINIHYTSLMMSGECQMALCTINIKVKHCFENVHVVSLWSLRLLMFHAIWLWMLHLNINRNVTSNDVIPLCFVGSSLHTFSLQFIRKANWTICLIGNHANCCGLESSFFSIFISNPNSTWMNNKRLLENNNVSRDTL